MSEAMLERMLEKRLDEEINIYENLTGIEAIRYLFYLSVTKHDPAMTLEKASSLISAENLPEITVVFIGFVMGMDVKKKTAKKDVAEKAIE